MDWSRIRHCSCRMRDFVQDLRGTASMEFALCFPVLIILFLQYMGINANMRFLETFERSTACLATVLANTTPIAIPEGSSETDEYRYTLFGGGLRDETIAKAFLAMMGDASLQGSLRITYSAGSVAGGMQKIIPLNGGDLLAVTGEDDQSLSAYRQLAQTASHDANYKYPWKLIRVEASITNTVKGAAWFLADAFFPETYQSSFVAVRSK